MVELHNIRKNYRERTVLDVPHLAVPDGETLALVGANGSGKTTLLRILAGTLRADAGTVCAPREVLYMPQKAYAFRGSVLDNVLIGTKGRQPQARELLGQLELDALADKKATSLSGGELQRLALCRLLIRPCALLLLDEPTASCDARCAVLVAEALKRYKAQTGCTVILSTHAPSFAVHVADRLVVLHDGRIQADGAPEETLRALQSDWADHFTAGWEKC